MNRYLPVLAALCCSIAASWRPEARAAELLDVSVFMMPPRQSWAQIGPSADPNVVVTEKLAGNGEVGFRVLHLRKSVKARKQAAVDLAKSGLVEPGDILLSFRPLWDGTLAYAHMQLGVSHSGMAFVVSEGDDPFVMTLESPISYSSPLNHQEHYADLDAIHVLRPQLDATQKANLEKWARLILTHPGRFNFFSDYAMPMYKRGIPSVATPADQIRRLAGVAMGSESGSFDSYCSEFVWSVLGLRNCDPSAFDQGCVGLPFATDDGMMTAIIPQVSGDAGLVQGSEAALVFGQFPPQDKTRILTESVFVDILTDPAELEGRMSAGHRKVAEDNRENMKVVNAYYAMGEPEEVAGQVNMSVAGNVSPTSFLIRSNARLDGLSYVGTVIFDR